MGRKRDRDAGKDPDFWEEGYFAETLSSADTKKRMRTFHMKHDEEMNFSCKRCGARISAHNRDWHAGMCDSCFSTEHFKKGGGK